MMVVEDGTGLPNANSYVSLWAAAQYWQLRANLQWMGGAATSATGELTATGQPDPGDQVTVGDLTYKFVTGAPEQEEDVAIGPTKEATLANLAAAISADPWAVAAVADAVLTVTARAQGTVGNSVPTTTDSPALSWAAPTLTGGTQTRPAAEQEAALVNGTAYLDLRWSGNVHGTLVDSAQALLFPRLGLPGCARGALLPTQVKNATIEYAMRALSGPLISDPERDPTGYALKRRREKTGPIEEEYEWAAGTGVGQMNVWPLYPSADGQMGCLLINTPGARNGRTIRA